MVSRFVGRDRDVLFWGRFSGGTQHDTTRRDAMRRDAKRRRRRTPPLKSQLFCRSFSLGRTRVAHESAREIFLAMTEVYQARLSHVGSPAGERTQCARSNYILLCLSTTHLSTHPLFLLLHILLVPSFATFSMSSFMSCWLAAPPRTVRVLRHRRRLDACQIEHDCSLNRVAIYVNFLFRRTVSVVHERTLAIILNFSPLRT